MLLSVLHFTVLLRSSWSLSTSDVDDIALLIRVSSAKQDMKESVMQLLMALMKIRNLGFYFAFVGLDSIYSDTL